MKQFALPRATSVQLEDLAEATFNAVLRAKDARLGDIKFPGTVTVGIIWDPQEPVPFDLRDQEIPRRGLTLGELSWLSPGGPITKESVRQIVDKLSKDRGIATRFAYSLGGDFAGTMVSLFKVTDAELEALNDISQERSSTLRYMSRILAETFAQEDELQFDLDITSSKKTSTTEKKKRIDWEISLKTSCDTNKTCKVEAGLTIKF